MSRYYLFKSKKLILLAFLDVNIFIISHALFKTNFHYLQIFVWLLISYIIGRYHLKHVSKLRYLIYSISLLLISKILFIFIIFFLNIYFKEIFYDFNLFYPKIFTYTFLSVSFINLINLFDLNFKEKKNFLFLGSKKSFDELTRFYNLTKNYDKIKYLDSFDQILTPYFSSKKNIVIYEDNFLTADDLFYLRSNSNIKFLDILVFQEKYLYSIKPEFLKKYLKSKSKNHNHFILAIQLKIKRFFDIFVSLILILVTSLIILFCSILIIIEDGMPFLFTQKRTGENLDLFDIYKLRTMKKDSEKNGPQWSKANDSRITKVGRFIRLTRIDELPQLFLVLRGKMSLIGPRPERPEIDKTIIEKIPNFNYRYKIKPGLSGWAQVNYPYGASINDSYIKLSYDLYYITNFSILLDLIIFLKTLKMVINLKGAIANK